MWMMQSVSITPSDEVKKELGKGNVDATNSQDPCREPQDPIREPNNHEKIEKGQQVWTSPIEMVTSGEELSSTSLTINLIPEPDANNNDDDEYDDGMHQLLH